MRRTPVFLTLVLSLSLVAAACGDDDDTADTTTTAVATATGEETTTTPMDDAADIVDTAVAAGEFPTLVAAVEAAGLVETLKGDGPFTVFAPTEDAFAALLDTLGLTADELLADTELLTSVLTYHVVAGNVPAADVLGLDGQEVETVNGASFTVGVDGNAVTITDANGGVANVVTTDIAASNGVIHVIDAVILPPQDGASEGDGAAEAADIVDTAVAAGEFPTLVAAVEAAGLVETLKGDGPFTVFAPTEDAFAALLEALGLTADELLADTELLTAVLTYHVVPGNVPAADVVGLDGQDVATVNGATVTVGVSGDAVTLTDANGGVANVVATDIAASNGVIHVIDSVLLPPQG